MEEKDNIFAPPESDLGINKPNDLPLASLAIRLGGAIIDGILNLIVTIPILRATGFWDRAMAGEVTIIETWSMAVLGLLIFLAMHGYLLATRGQTIGKWFVGSRIVSVDNNQVLPLSSVFLKRYLPISIAANIPSLGAVLPLADVLFIFRSDRRCLHDHLAGTKVIVAEPMK